MPDRLNRLKAVLCGGLALLAAAPTAALAHHSYSMFDRAKTSTITGTVRTWEMINPHSYLWVVVKKDDAPGGVQIWGLEGGGVQALTHAGVTKSAVKPGEKVSVDLHPLRDGRSGGMLVKVTLEDGKVIQMGGFAPPAGAAPAE